METLNTKEVEQVHAILRSEGLPCTESGAEKWLIKRGYSQERIRGKTLHELYQMVWVYENIPF